MKAIPPLIPANAPEQLSSLAVSMQLENARPLPQGERFGSAGEIHNSVITASVTKASPSVGHEVGLQSLRSELCPKGLSYWFSIYADLFKARLTSLVLLTTLVGFYMGFRGPMNYMLMLNTLLATALVAAGASALNQLMERDFDARMRRTQTRPLPSGRLQPVTAFWIGCICAISGLIYLLMTVNVTTCAVGAASLLSYLFVYTPLKRVSWLNTAAGAVPGALPPLMGWTAATGHLDFPALSLFGILALWQIPHFLAIAWVYRDEYARAGFKMLPNVDPTGKRCGRQAVGLSFLLLLLSISPFFLNMAGLSYLVGAVTLGLLFFWFSIRFSRYLDVPQARRLFFASILYLPLLLGLLVLDKIK